MWDWPDGTAGESAKLGSFGSGTSSGGTDIELIETMQLAGYEGFKAARTQVGTSKAAEGECALLIVAALSTYG